MSYQAKSASAGGLTRRDRAVMEVLEEAAASGSVMPSMDEICTRLGIASKATVFRSFEDLEQRGYIRRHRHAARAIEILRPAGLTRDQRIEAILAEFCKTASPPSSVDALREILQRLL